MAFWFAFTPRQKPGRTGGLRIAWSAKKFAKVFWFVNPAGIVFGEGAAVNVPAAAHFSTASSLGFADGARFQIATPGGSTLSVAPPEAFGFVGGEANILFDPGTVIGTPGQLTLAAANIGLTETGVLAAAITLAAVGPGEAEVLLDGSAVSPLTGQLILLGSEVDALAASRGDGSLTINAGNVGLSGSQLGVFTADATPGGNLTITAATLDLLDGSALIASSGLGAAGHSGGIFVTVSDAIGVFDSRVQADAQGSGNGGNVRLAANSIVLENAQLAALTFAEGNGGSLTVEAAQSLTATNTSVFNSSLGTGGTGDVLLHGGSVSLTGLFVGAQPSTIGGEGNVRGGVGDVRIIADSELAITSTTITTETFGAGKAGDVRLAGGTVAMDTVTILAGTTTFADDGPPGDAGSIEIAATGTAQLNNVVINSTARAMCFDVCPSGNAGSITVSGSDVTVFGSMLRSEVFGNGNAGAIGLFASGALEVSSSDLASGAFAAEDTPGVGGNAGSISLTGRDVTLAATFVAANTFGGDGGQVQIDAQDAVLVTNGSFITSDTFGAGAAGGIFLTGSSIEISGFAQLAANTFGDGDAFGIDLTADTITLDSVFLSSDTAGSGRAGFLFVTAEDVSIAASRLTSDSTGTGSAGDIFITAGTLSISDGSTLSSDGLADGNAGNVLIDVVGRLDIVDSTLSSSARNDFFDDTTVDAGRIEIVAGDLSLRNTFVSIDNFGSGSGNEIAISAGSVEIVDSAVSSDALGDGDAGSIDVIGDTIAVSGSQLTSSTVGGGNAGAVGLVAFDAIALDSSRIASSSTGQGLAGFVGLAAPTIDLTASEVQTDFRFTGVSGFITIESDALTVDSSAISANTFNGTRADNTFGLILIGGSLDFAAQSIVLRNGSEISTNTDGPGDGGDITIQSEAVDLIDSVIQARSLSCGTECASVGPAGTITIASDALTVSGSDPDRPTTISSNTETDGSAGNIALVGLGLMASTLAITGSKATISSQSAGSGHAGSITIALDSVEVAEGARITTSTSATATGQGGNIAITAADQLIVRDGGKIEADTSFVCTTDACGDAGRGGAIDVTAGTLVLSGDGQENTTYIRANSLGTADAGQVTIMVTDNLTASDSAYVSSDALGDGMSGGISVTVGETLSLTSGAFFSSDVSGSGDAGNVMVEAGELVLEIARISSNANGFSAGNAGTVTVMAEDLTLSSSIISSNVGFGSSGDGGSVTVSAPSITMRDFASISSGSFGSGNSGEVFVSGGTIRLFEGSSISSDALGTGTSILAAITATGELSLDDGSFISTDTAGGDAGDIEVNAATLRLSNGSSISSNVFAFEGSLDDLGGDAGNVTVTVGGLLELSSLSSITSDTDAETSGDSGEVTVAAREIRLLDSSLISSNTLGAGNALLVDVSATSSLTLDGLSVISSNAIGDGDAGFVVVTAPRVSLGGTSFISSNSVGTGDAQIVAITANSLDLSGSFVTSNSFGSGNGGGIFLDVGQLNARAGSAILTNAFDTGDAGFIGITAQSVTLENSEIASEAREALGGQFGFDIAGTLSLSNSRIGTNSSGAGDAGGMFISAGAVDLANGSSISSAATETSTGNSGFISLTVADLLTVREGSAISTSSANANPAGPIEIAAGELALVGSGLPNLPNQPANASITSSNTGTGDAGSIDIVQTSPGLGSGITLSEGAVITTSSVRANAGQITIDMAPGTILRLEGRTENALIDTSAPQGSTGGQVLIGQTSPPYAVILNGGSILALGQPDPNNLRINAGFLIRSADRRNEILIGSGEEVDSQFEDVSSGIVTTSLDVVDASRVLSGACPAARARGGQFSQFARPMIGPYAVAVEAEEPQMPPVSLQQTGTALAALTRGGLCR